MGTDLSAQVAHADFFDAAKVAPLDLRWYGGTVQWGYSLLAPELMALLGVRLTGALAGAAASVALALLLRRTGALRPTLGGIVGAFCVFGNLASGRVTYALGVAFVLCGLWALARDRRILAVVGVLLGAACSPVAGLFAGLAGAALFLGTSERARRVDGVLLGIAGAVPIGVTAALGDAGGWMNISVSDTVRAVAAAVLVAVFVPQRVIRVGAALAALGVLAAFAVHTPVGLNATRLAAMFTLPVLLAYAPRPSRPAPWPRTAAAAALVAVAFVQSPVMVGDLRDMGDPTASRRYFAPLLAQLHARAPVGRVEVLATRNYWESAHVAREFHLARGWLRQADLARNPLFYDGTLDASSYGAWLRDNGVSYVAVPDAPLSWVSRREADIVRGGQPYLMQVWRGADWTLYEVAGRPSIVDGGTLLGTTPTSVSVDLPGPGTYVVRVRWSRWLRAAGAQLRQRPDGWTDLTVRSGGGYRLEGGYTEPPPD
ncbi:hypothetical protein [Virgisporangium aliadipatigenens]